MILYFVTRSSRKYRTPPGSNPEQLRTFTYYVNARLLTEATCAVGIVGKSCLSQMLPQPTVSCDRTNHPPDATPVHVQQFPGSFPVGCREEPLRMCSSLIGTQLVSKFRPQPILHYSHAHRVFKFKFIYFS